MAGALPLAGGAAGAAGAPVAPAGQVLRLVVPTAQQTVRRWEGEDVALYDLGVYALAEKAALEFRAQRGRLYRDPVRTTLSIGTGAARTTTALPPELMPDVDDLDRFFALRVTNAAGKVVKRADIGFCPNSALAARAVPGGAAQSPYPYECGSHPFARGNVFGIQRGWSVPALGDWESPASFSGPDGVYNVHLLIRGPWRQALGLTSGRSQADITIRVVTEDGDFEDSAARRATGRAAPLPGTATAAGTAVHQHGTAGGHAAHASASAGRLSPQHAAMEAARRRALGRANVPAAAPPSRRVRAVELPAGPRPDLRSLPAYQIVLDRTDGQGGPSNRTYLNFGATVWNAGPSPLVVDGFRRPGTGLMDAYQYVYDSAGNEVGSTPAGTLEWDPREGHDHWHFTAFATYRLLDSTQKVTKRSGKEAFCLVPTDPVDLNTAGANWRPASTDLSTACGGEGALSIREVLDTGWGDTYAQDLPGQSFDITTLANGVYYLEVLANPDRKLVESNLTNNRALRKISLGGTVGGRRTLKVFPYQGLAVP